jgi:hypothetical protein
MRILLAELKFLRLGLVLLVSFMGSVFAGAELGTNDWLVLMRAPREGLRLNARESALRERRDLVERLLAVANQPIVEGEEFWNSGTSRNVAITVLGRYRAVEAVPSLMRWLVVQKGQSSSLSELRVFSHAAEALVEIGLPALPPLVDKLASEGRKTPLGDMCVKTVVAILGPETAEFKLKSLSEKEADVGKKRNLQDILDSRILYTLRVR